jgi:hypothetical protein
MNIFVLSYDPVEAAEFSCDKHCIKMTTELFQQLGSALRRHGAVDSQMPATKMGTPLIGGHKNHPCTLWCGETRSNFEWAAAHALALADEYTYRYGKIHFCKSGIEKMLEMADMIPAGSMTPFAQAMPENYKNSSAVVAYRDFYWYDKRVNIDCSWKKKRKAPDWWLEMESK